MKKMMIVMALLITAIEGTVAQQINNSPMLTREAYLKKNRNQKQGSVLLVVVGCTVGLVGGVISAAGSAGSGPSGPAFPVVPVAIGAGCIGGGIALSKASARNKQKALAASGHFNLLNIPSYQFTTPRMPYMPALAVKLPLN